MNQEKEKNAKRKITSKQVVAMAGVILLVLLYLITLVTAIADHTSSAQWFRICLAATIALPLIIWIYTWLYGRLTNKPAIGDPAADTSMDDADIHHASKHSHNP